VVDRPPPPRPGPESARAAALVPKARPVLTPPPSTAEPVEASLERRRAELLGPAVWVVHAGVRRRPTVGQVTTGPDGRADVGVIDGLTPEATVSAWRVGYLDQDGVTLRPGPPLVVTLEPVPASRDPVDLHQEHLQRGRVERLEQTLARTRERSTKSWRPERRPSRRRRR
jgi:hypothetical protein